MDYKLFCKLVREGEQPHVDFKVDCQAFAVRTQSPRAELAKDICAMANNANRTSYIIVGVSDDRRSFRSVQNAALTDDHLQDFCKRAVFPPPEVKLLRKRWRNGKGPHRGKEFVIIQVGPRRDGVYRLNQDFICYRESLCYRRNGVWIRRRQTSDLATPEEIVRLWKGQPLVEDPELQETRRTFASMSVQEKRSEVESAVEGCLVRCGYAATTMGSNRMYQMPRFWKRVKSVVILLELYGCKTSLLKKDLEWLRSWGCFSDSFFEWSELPEDITKLGRRKIRAIRGLELFSVIKPVPVERITDLFRTARKTEGTLHFYLPKLRVRLFRKDRRYLPSSRELLVLDRIRSAAEHTEELERALEELERRGDSLVTRAQ